MIIRNYNGVIKIISRKDCKNETVYNKKIYEIMNEYAKNYNSIYYSLSQYNNTNNSQLKPADGYSDC